MRHRVAFAAMIFLAMTILVAPTYSQTCLTSPNVTVMTSGSWAFRLSGFSVENRMTEFVSAVGVFRPTVGVTGRSSIPQGILTTTISVNVGGTMRDTLMPVTGSWQLDPGPLGNCMSGTLHIGSGTFPAGVRSVRFVLQEGGMKMSLVSDGNDGMILSGNAAMTLITPSNPAICDLASNPNAMALTSGPWAFGMDGFGRQTNGNLTFVAANGMMLARVGTTARAPNVVQGLTYSTVSINMSGTMYTVLMPVEGKFQLDAGPNGDCSTGTALLASGSDPTGIRGVRFALYQGGTKMFLMSTDNDGAILSGDASRF